MKILAGLILLPLIILVGIIARFLTCVVRLIRFFLSPEKTIEEQFISDDHRESEIRSLGKWIYLVYLGRFIVELAISPYIGSKIAFNALSSMGKGE